MIYKQKKAQKGPSWLEVGFGAAFSVVLGVLLGAAYLATKTVQTVKEIPKDAPSGAVYYIEGKTEFYKDAVITEKRRDLTDGQTITVSEGELNALIGSLSKPSAPAKSGDKAAPAGQKALDTGMLNVRINGGKIQFSDTVTYNVLGVNGSLIIQATGVFSKHGSVFQFDPESIYAGGCPVQRLPILKDWVLKKFLFVQAVPDDIAAAWSKLADVSIDGSTLRLRMP